MSVGPPRWTWRSMSSIACWTWDARTTSGSPEHLGAGVPAPAPLIRATCVDAPLGARRIVRLGAARRRVLTCVRPLMRRVSCRGPGWEFADRVQIKAAYSWYGVACVSADLGARRIVRLGAARRRVLTCVRPLMRRVSCRGPGWEFADRVQIKAAYSWYGVAHWFSRPRLSTVAPYPSSDLPPPRQPRGRADG